MGSATLASSILCGFPLHSRIMDTFSALSAYFAFTYSTKCHLTSSWPQVKISAEPSCVWTPHTGPKKTNFPSLGKMLSSLKGYYCFIVVAGMSEGHRNLSRGEIFKGSFCWVKNTTVDYIYHLSPTYPPIMWLTLLLEVPNKDSNILKVLLFTQLNGQSCVVVLLNFISKSMISIHSSIECWGE